MYNFHDVAMDFTKTQKSKYLENEFLFFLRIITHKGQLYGKKYFSNGGNL